MDADVQSGMHKISRERVTQLARDLLEAMTRTKAVMLLKEREVVRQSIAHALADELKREEEREEKRPPPHRHDEEAAGVTLPRVRHALHPVDGRGVLARRAGQLSGCRHQQFVILSLPQPRHEFRCLLGSTFAAKDGEESPAAAPVANAS